MKPPPLALRRSMPLGLLGMLVLIGLFESLLVQHDRWFTIVEADAWKLARARADQPWPGGVLTMGDSQVLIGVSPRSIESHLGQPVQCLALPGGQPPATYFMLREVLQARRRPAAIVVNFEPQLLQEQPLIHARMWPGFASFDECLDLARTLGSWDAFTSMLARKLLPSLAGRAEIRGAMLTKLQGVASPVPGYLAMNRRNLEQNRGALLLAKQDQNRERGLLDWFNPAATPWKPDPVNAAYVHRFLQLTQQQQIPVCCAVMPLLEVLKHKARANQIEPAYLAWLRQLQERYPHLTILDWRDAGYPDSVFVDPQHLDVEGAAAVGIALGDYLKAALAGAGTRERWVAMPRFQRDGSHLGLEDQLQSFAATQAATTVRR